MSRRRPMKAPRAKAALVALGLSLLLAMSFCWPITSQSGLLNSTGPVIRYLCPESGRLAPAIYSSRTHRDFAMETCLDRNGERIYDRSLHKAIMWSVIAFWTLALFGPFLAIFTALFVHGEGSTRRYGGQARVALRRGRGGR
jgi:hypothetical protein